MTEPAYTPWQPIPGQPANTDPRPTTQRTRAEEREADLAAWAHIAKFLGVVAIIAVFMFVAAGGTFGA